jgi:hypothetical protein
MTSLIQFSSTVKIGAAVQFFAPNLLRRHVAAGAAGDSGACQIRLHLRKKARASIRDNTYAVDCFVRDEFCDAENPRAHRRRRCQKDVGRLDVAMDDVLVSLLHLGHELMSPSSERLAARRSRRAGEFDIRHREKIKFSTRSYDRRMRRGRGFGCGFRRRSVSSQRMMTVSPRRPNALATRASCCTSVRVSTSGISLSMRSIAQAKPAARRASACRRSPPERSSGRTRPCHSEPDRCARVDLSVLVQ